MWNVVRIRVNISFSRVQKMKHDQLFFLFVCLLFSFLSFWHMAHFNYSAAACCIWTMCFVSFVLNLGSVLLSESVNHKIDKNNLRLRNVNHRQ